MLQRTRSTFVLLPMQHYRNLITRTRAAISKADVTVYVLRKRDVLQFVVTSMSSGHGEKHASNANGVSEKNCDTLCTRRGSRLLCP